MATVTSLKTHGITKIKLDEDAVTFSSTLVSQGMLDNIETMICTRKQLDGLNWLWPSLALKSNFVGLKCLVLDIRFLSRYKLYGDECNDYDDEELECFFGMLANLTGLYIYIEMEGSRGGLKLMRIILRSLPKLKDLVIHRSRHDSVLHFTPGGHSHSIERFSCTDISCMKIRPLL